jgi:hypothetical protein
MKIISTIVLSLVISFAWAQKVKESEVPAAVKDAFAKKYAGVKVEKWEKEEGNYEAEFDQGKNEMSAVFNPGGTFMQEEVEIKTSALPAAAGEYCKTNGFKLEEATKITDIVGKVSYEAEVKKGKEEFDLMFDDKGSFLKKTAEGKEDKDDKKGK